MNNELNFNKEALRLFKEQMAATGFSQTKVARLLNVAPSSVNRMLRGKTIMLDKLQHLSVIFGYNFFTKLSDLLDLPEPPKQVTGAASHIACNERIRELEIENQTLMKLLKADR
jgi:transcriptional regulator with XRE-family HTH domain